VASDDNIYSGGDVLSEHLNHLELTAPSTKQDLGVTQTDVEMALSQYQSNYSVELLQPNDTQYHHILDAEVCHSNCSVPLESHSFPRKSVVCPG
jgi:hypothetical protein